MSDNDAYYGNDYDSLSDAGVSYDATVLYPETPQLTEIIARWDATMLGPYFQWDDGNVWELYGAPPESTLTFDDGTLLTVQGHSLKIIQVPKQNTPYWPDSHTALALTHSWGDVRLLLELLRKHAPHLFPVNTNEK